MIKVFYLIDFFVFYLLDIILGAIRVAFDVVTPTKHSTPGVVKIPLKADTDFEISLLSNLITFSPGSMVIDVDPDRSHIYVHVMFLENKEQWKKDFKLKFESRVLRILR